MMRGHFHIKNLYCWICHIVTLPITSVVATIYAFAQFDNFVWGTRHLNVDQRHFVIHQLKFFLLKLSLILGYIFFNSIYLLVGFYYSQDLLNWLVIGYTIIEFILVFFLPTFLNFVTKISFKKKLTSITFGFRKILKRINL